MLLIRLANELDGLHRELDQHYAQLAGMITKMEMDKLDSSGLGRHSKRT